MAAQQPLPDALVWERVGDIENVDWLTFHGDTLYAGTQTNSDLGRYYGVAALRPGEDWAPWLPRVYYLDDMAFCGDGLVFALGFNVNRSIDGGTTFETVYGDGPQTMPFRVPDGGLIVGVNSSTRAAARSDDGGVTWAVPDGPDIALTPYAFAVPGAVPGRVVGVGFGGIGTSDDGGRTWAPTNLQGDLAYAGSTVATVAEGPNDGGHGGAVVAVLEGNGGGLGRAVVRSADGAAWEVVGPSPGGYAYTARLLAAPDGALYLYSVYFGAAEDQSSDPVYRSTDGGTTWEDVGPVWADWWAVPSEIVVGPDGRLWASANGHYQYGLRVGGVFRTVDPIYAVAAEGGPVGAEELGVRIWPNPAGGRVTVEVAGLGAGAVRVAVTDALGREVAVIYDGPARNGQRVAVETAGWPAGVYHVRAVSERGEARASLTVVR